LREDFISLKTKYLGEDKSPLGLLLVSFSKHLKFVRAHTCPHVAKIRIVFEATFLVYITRGV
jgi:hypothetical protein